MACLRLCSCSLPHSCYLASCDLKIVSPSQLIEICQICALVGDLYEYNDGTRLFLADHKGYAGYAQASLCMFSKRQRAPLKKQRIKYADEMTRPYCLHHGLLGPIMLSFFPSSVAFFLLAIFVDLFNSTMSIRSV